MGRFFIGVIGLLALIAVSESAVSETLISKGAAWSYLDDGSNQNTAWQAPDFNDSAWKIGPAQLGYGDGDEATVVGYGPDPNNKYITTYFRRHFNVANPADYLNLTLNIQRDDGAVIYINGVEVRRENMPAGAITSTTTTANTASETTFYSSSIPADVLVAGGNVIAVEVHQTGVTSSDISFDLELIGNTGGNSTANVIRGPYLQMASPSTMTVRWRTDVATDSRVNFGTAQGSLTQFADNAAETTEHEVKITGLSPETRYWYSVGSTADELAGGGASTYFNTGPVAGEARPTRIWVIGDAGTGTSGQSAVYNAYRNFTGSAYTNLWLLLGDNAYSSGTDTEYQAKFFNIYPDLLKQSPVWPTIGNHDAASADSATESGPYYDIFTLPKNAEAGGLASGTEAYYSFDYANIHFIVLDSQETDRSASGTMANWLKSDLQANAADWVIAFWHHPPYSKGSHNSDTESRLIEMRQNFLPILEQYGVDLVLTGHSHSYERSQFIDGHYGDSGTFNAGYVVQSGSGRTDDTGAYEKASGGASHDGAVYAVAGSSGQISGGTLNHPAMYISLNELGSVVLDINGSTLDAKFINNNGALRDYFTISKGASPPPPFSTTTELQNGLNGYAGSVDSYVASGKASTNYGNAAAILADGNDGKNGREMALLQWSVIGIPAGKVVESGVLSLTFANGSKGAYNVYALNSGWTENTVSWENLDPISHLGVLVGTIPPGGTGTKQIQLNAAGVSLLQAWINGTAANNGLIIVDAGTNDNIGIRSSEYGTADQRPKLAVTYH
ncbi:MAG: DNRLRE domain-containing protein [Gammaproteobacteria bacterium]